MNESTGSEKRAQILDAAQKRFAHYGISKVTMDEIAADLGMSKAALYYYFKTKEEVFRDVVVREQALFVESAERILAKKSAAGAKMREYCRQRLDYIFERTGLKLLGIEAWSEARPLIGDLIQSFFLKEQEILLRIIKEGKKSGEFRVESTEKTAAVILHAVHGLRLRMFKNFNDYASFQELLPQLREETDLLIDLILHGLALRSH